MIPKDIIVVSDPRILKVPILECGEPLVDVREFPKILVDKRYSGAQITYSKVRKTVAEKLKTAARYLNSSFRILLIEGHRPISMQKKYFEEYRNKLKIKYPDLNNDELYGEASKYIAPPDIVPPHSTGGAVDITLASREGVEIDMGVRVNATPEESMNACFTLAENIPDESKAMRRALGEAMSMAGFVNYPTEFWHWSYGERYWAYQMGEDAVYGSVE